MFRDSVKNTGYPLHSPLSLSLLPFRASPCAITFQLESTKKVLTARGEKYWQNYRHRISNSSLVSQINSYGFWLLTPGFFTTAHPLCLLTNVYLFSYTISSVYKTLCYNLNHHSPKAPQFTILRIFPLLAQNSRRFPITLSVKDPPATPTSLSACLEQQ